MIRFLPTRRAISASLLLVATACGTAEVVDAPGTGEISVLVTPDARILVNGEEKGVGSSVVLEDLAPGEYAVRLEADGYATVERKLRLGAGSREKVIEQLVAAQAPPEPVAGDVEPEPDTAPPEVTEPPDGEAEPEPEPEPAKVAAKPKAPAGPPGQLSIGIAGGGWGNVWIDGKKLDKTAPLTKHELPPGSHTVRVVNEGSGLDQTRTVEVVSGKLVKVTVKPE